MVFNNNIVEITSAVTLSNEYNLYIVNAATPFTITLPPITSNGMNFELSRVDNTSNIVSISGGGANIDGNSSMTFYMLTSSLLISYANNWYRFDSYPGVTATVMMQEIFFSTGNDTVGIVGTEFVGAFGMPNNAQQANSFCIAAGNFSRLMVTLNTPSTVGNRVFELFVNNTSVMSVTLTGSQTQAINTVTTATINANATFRVRCTNNGPDVDTGCLVTVLFTSP